MSVCFSKGDAVVFHSAHSRIIGILIDWGRDGLIVCSCSLDDGGNFESEKTRYLTDGQLIVPNIYERYALYNRMVHEGYFLDGKDFMPKRFIFRVGDYVTNIHTNEMVRITGRQFRNYNAEDQHGRRINIFCEKAHEEYRKEDIQSRITYHLGEAERLLKLIGKRQNG